jgi:hypothetical protein
VFSFPAREFEPALTVEAPLRYDDVAQDGSLKVDAMPNFVGPSWAGLYAKTELSRACARDGIVPILTRLSAERLARPISAIGSIELRSAMTIGRAGERWLLVFDLDLVAHEAHLFTQSTWGVKRRVGRVRAEHVFTRPFGAPERRKVTSLPVEPEHAVEIEWASSGELGAIPSGARPPIEWAKTFELHHTDSNQHVNSLVYPRAFEAASLGALGEPGRWLARSYDVFFRKPCFAGEQCAITTHVTEHEGAPATVASLAVDGATRIYGRMRFEAPPSAPFG